MAVGLQTNKQQLDAQIGNICLQTRNVLAQWQNIYTFFAGLTDDEIRALGYDSDGFTACRTLQQRTGEVVAALTGNGTITATHDYQADWSVWWGSGIGT